MVTEKLHSIDPLTQVFGRHRENFDQTFNDVELASMAAMGSERLAHGVLLAVWTPQTRLANSLMILELALMSGWISDHDLKGSALLGQHRERVRYTVLSNPIVSRTCSRVRDALFLDDPPAQQASPSHDSSNNELFSLFADIQDDMLDVLFDRQREKFVARLIGGPALNRASDDPWLHISQSSQKDISDTLAYLDGLPTARTEPTNQPMIGRFRSYLDGFRSYVDAVETLGDLSAFLDSARGPDDATFERGSSHQDFSRLVILVSGSMLGWFAQSSAAERFVTEHFAGYFSVLSGALASLSPPTNEPSRRSATAFLQRKSKSYSYELDRMKKRFDRSVADFRPSAPEANVINRPPRTN